MRSAICISGLARTYKKTVKSFNENILAPLKELGQTDVFVSIWDKPDIADLIPVKALDFYVAVAGDGELAGYQIRDRDLNYTEEDLDANEIYKLYSPKCLEVENFNSLKELFHLSKYTSRKCPVPSIMKGDLFLPMVSQYKILKCNLLKTNYENMHNFTYDLVVRARFDFEIEKLRVGELELDKLNCLYCQDDKKVSDYFYISNSTIMDRVCGLFYNYDYLFNQVDTFWGDRSLKAHMDTCEVKVKEMKGYKYTFVRELFRQDYYS